MPTYQKQPKDWLLFEHEVRQLVEAFGYKAETTQPSHDSGVDVIAFHQTRRLVIQCKLYGRGSIGAPVITQLAGCRQLFHVTDALCITTSRFTHQAQEVAKQLNIHLIDREKLLLLCRERNLTIPSLTGLEYSTGYVIDLQQAQITLGRDPSNIVKINDHNISRHHARLIRQGLHLAIEDCGSTNGTFVNGNRITRPTLLNYDDAVVLGNVGFTICLALGQRSGKDEFRGISSPPTMRS